MNNEELESIESMLSTDTQDEQVLELLGKHGLNRQAFYMFVSALRDTLEHQVAHKAVTDSLEERFSREEFESLIQDSLRVAGLLEAKETGKVELPSKYKFAEEIPQSTFAEFNACSHALFSGRRMQDWIRSEGEIALLHREKSSRYEIRFLANLLTEYWDIDPSYEFLEGHIQKMGGTDAVVLLCLCMNIALQPEEDRKPVTIDEMITQLKWNVRNNAHRKELRKKVWTWVTCLASMSVHGSRFPHERFKDEMTGKTYKGTEVTTNTPLFYIEAGYGPEQQPKLDGSEPPLFFEVIPGGFIKKYRLNPRMLTYIGNIRMIAAIPGGQPSGAWARAYALILQQRWREAASKVVQITITREQLHSIGQPEPYLQEILNGNNPKRAIDYDREAWVYLHEQDIIANNPKELCFPYDPKKRKGWAKEFLTQPLNLIPGTKIREQIQNIQERTPRTRKARGKKS
jgi:hypothetical protein